MLREIPFCGVFPQSEPVVTQNPQWQRQESSDLVKQKQKDCCYIWDMTLKPAFDVCSGEIHDDLVIKEAMCVQKS